MKKIDVAVLGATGTVGQKFVALIEQHPWFVIRELVASERSAGSAYGEVCHWRESTPMPARVASMKVRDTAATLESPVLFSGLDSTVAGEAETHYATQGHVIISNSKNHRMDADVPLVIPEINSAHLVLIRTQRYKGAIVTNPNCSSVFLTMVLAPLHQQFGVERVLVTTMQAVSGAGYPGVASLDILGNVVPYIEGEEEKIEREPLKILGSMEGAQINNANFVISAQCTRVPVIDGHTESISIQCATPASLAQVRKTLEEFRGEIASWRLPSAPPRPLIVTDAPNRPQSRLDVHRANGMSTIIGRMRACGALGVKMMVLGHNTVRGAAGAALLNAEALYHLGLLNDYC